MLDAVLEGDWCALPLDVAQNDGLFDRHLTGLSVFRSQVSAQGPAMSHFGDRALDCVFQKDQHPPSERGGRPAMSLCR